MGFALLATYGNPVLEVAYEKKLGMTFVHDSAVGHSGGWPPVKVSDAGGSGWWPSLQISFFWLMARHKDGKDLGRKQACHFDMVCFLPHFISLGRIGENGHLCCMGPRDRPQDNDSGICRSTKYKRKHVKPPCSI